MVISPMPAINEVSQPGQQLQLSRFSQRLNCPEQVSSYPVVQHPSKHQQTQHCQNRLKLLQNSRMAPWRWMPRQGLHRQAALHPESWNRSRSRRQVRQQMGRRTRSVRLQPGSSSWMRTGPPSVRPTYQPRGQRRTNSRAQLGSLTRLPSPGQRCNPIERMAEVGAGAPFPLESYMRLCAVCINYCAATPAHQLRTAAFASLCTGACSPA